MSEEDRFKSAKAVAEAWLKASLHCEQFADAPGYVAWTYERDALHFGTLELINDPELSQGKNRYLLSVGLSLPPIRTVEDAFAIFNLSEWLDGITVVTKDFGNEGALMLQCKGSLMSLTEATLNAAFSHLKEAKKFMDAE